MSLRPSEQRRDPTAELRRLQILPSASLFEAMGAVDVGARGITFVVNEAGRVVGSLTDGDIRRAILAGNDVHSRCVERIMSTNFTAVTPDTRRVEVLDLMRARHINVVPIVDTDGKLIGLHLLRELFGGETRPNWAFVLAGGKGTRLRPLTENIPKPLIAVAGRPILERIVLHLVGHGFRRIFLSVNYLGHMIEDHFGDGSHFGCRIEYIHETQPLGTGGPLKLLPEPIEHPMLVMNGDLVTQFDIDRLVSFHKRGDFVATLGLRPYHQEVPFGVADVQGDRLTGMREKPRLEMLVNAGIYMVSQAAVDLIEPNEEFPITELFNRALGKGLPVGAHLIEDEWLDVGRHDELNKARGQ
ncbi:MAG: nucleotidyltransferase family protein [Phycisphaerae bacterium]|nr:nucleotidyltransferase family protein [Gemmatimonadaceae bacterium]